jgi:integrase
MLDSHMKVLREGRVRVTKQAIEAAWRRRRSGQRIVITDLACPGLALIVNAQTMSWVYSYKPRGIDPTTGRRFPTRSITIGSPETHSPEAARNAAGTLKGQNKAGIDPAHQRRTAIAAAAERRAATVDRLAEDYARHIAARAKLRGTGRVSADYAAREVSRVKAAIAGMGAPGKGVADITDRDVRRLLDATAGQPGAARHRFGALSRFLDWCRDEGHIATNPCLAIAKTRRPKPIRPREHVLRPAELAELWHAAGRAEELAPVQRDFLRFLITVPCRRNEGATVEWPHLDLDAAEWSQPGALTKNRDPHRFHLHPLALALLRERWESAGCPKTGLVFPAPKSGRQLTTFSALKAAIARAAGRDDWRIHDFRRSFATALGEAGIAEPVVDAILNHRQSSTRGGVLGVYQRAQRWPEQVAAMKHWGEVLAAAIASGDTLARGQRAPVAATVSSDAAVSGAAGGSQ